MSAVLAERRKELKDRQQKELRQMEEEHNENLQRLQDEKQDDVKETFFAYAIIKTIMGLLIH